MAGKLKILIVEDEFISRSVLQAMLSPFGECATADDGAEAMKILRASYEKPEGKYDLVCLDLMMPSVSGQEIFQEIRHIERRKGLEGRDATKVMVVSGLADAQSRIETLNVGSCAAYLTKPVSKTQLEEQLRHLQLIETSASSHEIPYGRSSDTSRC